MTLALGNESTFGALNGYWGQSPGATLREYCDSGVQYATVGFVNQAPEHDPTKNGYPSINFSSFCDGVGYIGKNGLDTGLQSNCASLKTDIPYCQSKGVKVILSIGGWWSEQGNNYKVSSDENGESFADFLYSAFGPYTKSWNGPRPFDSDSQHVAVDGFDFDLEIHALDNKPYIAMINRLRSLDRSLLITGAPQCPTNPAYFDMKEMIQTAAFDALFIQFYNNPSCDVIPQNDNWPDKFSYGDWVDIVAKSDKSKSAKLFIGLLGSLSAAGETPARSGYVGPEKVKELVCQYKSTTNFGGISLWDLNRAAENIVGGKSFYQHVLDALQYGCNPVPTTTSTSKTSTKTPSASPTKPTSSSTPSKPTTTSTSNTSSTSKATSSSSAKATTTSSTKQITTSSVPVNSTTSTSGGVKSSEPITTSSIVSSTGVWSNSTMTSSTSVPMTTSTAYTTTVHTVTECPPYVINCPKTGYVTTETIPLYTTVCPVTQTAPLPMPTATEETKTSVPVTVPLTISTIYTTKVHTVTACPPQVTNCPQGQVTTEVIPWYTTVCPVKETEMEIGKIPQPTPLSTGGVNPPQSTTTTEATSTMYNNTVPGASSTMQTFTKPTAATPKPSCSGQGCPGVSSTPVSGCPGPNCFSSVALPTESWTNVSFGPSTIPTKPVQAGVSTLAIGLTGLIAMVVVQVFAL
ncbi:Uncharacterized protein TPAR_03546 [Tolypocladium paradoxum]|uniref:GH18 domain-containing protein n=1 Tax=Tolypocladium paradoxum TaxID=94208 RepID=A0A2S4L1H9_9HYPO|nr:Uncharacterized protein TPAR_03546 [Tolypocladium paradoxum]